MVQDYSLNNLRYFERSKRYFRTLSVPPKAGVCLLLIRTSRLVDSKGPPKPRGRAQFEGILGLFVVVVQILVTDYPQAMNAQ